MTIVNVPILLILFIFAIVTHAWSDPDKSMNVEKNRVTTMKVDENKGVVQKKRKPVPKPATPIKRRNSKSPSALPWPEDEAAMASTKGDVDFLKVVEEKRRSGWIDLDPILSSPEFFRSTRWNTPLRSRETPTAIFSNADFSQSIWKPFGNQYFEGGTKLEVLRRLELKKEQILREIFMGLRFSFTPTSRHVVLEMNLSPSYERGAGLIIPF